MFQRKNPKALIRRDWSHITSPTDQNLIISFARSRIVLNKISGWKRHVFRVQDFEMCYCPWALWMNWGYTSQNLRPKNQNVKIWFRTICDQSKLMMGLWLIDDRSPNLFSVVTLCHIETSWVSFIPKINQYL